jgi:membrane protein
MQPRPRQALTTSPEESSAESVERRPRAAGSDDLSLADWRAILVRAARESLDDNVPMMASALAYSAFFAIPSVLLVVLGVFTLVADTGTVSEVVEKLTAVAPPEAATLVGDSLERLVERPSAGIMLTIVGLVLAVWSATSAMGTVMTALNVAYDCEDTRSLFRKRLVALAMAVCVGTAALLAGVLLIFGPHVQAWIGDALEAEAAVSTLWWIAQWPILVAALLLAFTVVLALGPDIDRPRWQLLVPGAAVAVVVWLLVSGVFSLYTTWFGSYNKTWGSLAAVIVTLTWLWLAGIALLFGGELNAEAQRCRTRGERRDQG